MLNILLPKNVLSISLFSFSYSSPSNSIAFNHYKLPHSFQNHSKNKCSPSFYPILYLVSILLLLVSLYYFVILRYSGFLPFLTVHKGDRISVNILSPSLSLKIALSVLSTPGYLLFFPRTAVHAASITAPAATAAAANGNTSAVSPVFTAFAAELSAA